MYDSYVKDVFVFSLFFYENPNLLGIYLFISEETESKGRNNLHSPLTMNL